VGTPADVVAFADGVLESLLEDLVRPAGVGPRAAEDATYLLVSLFGSADGPPSSRFQGPRFVLGRSGDSAAALERYERLRGAYVPKGRPRVLARQVEELAAYLCLASREAWFEVRDLFGPEGAAERARHDEALARRSRGEAVGDLQGRLGAQSFATAAERAARLVALHAACFRGGLGPVLAEAVMELPARIRTEGRLDSLRRTAGFELELRLGTLGGPMRSARIAYPPAS
jgi:hypothetical protein